MSYVASEHAREPSVSSDTQKEIDGDVRVSGDKREREREGKITSS